jgi:hypothetical protein
MVDSGELVKQSRSVESDEDTIRCAGPDPRDRPKRCPATRPKTESIPDGWQTIIVLQKTTDGFSSHVLDYCWLHWPNDLREDRSRRVGVGETELADSSSVGESADDE